MKVKNLKGEKGQAAVLITILLMFGLIALTALAIDGGHLYVVRRDLQNMTDAACLAAATELSLGGDEAAAIEIAREYVIRNGGTEEFYAPPDGDGVGLVKGIQVSGADVRVALQEDVDTYFTMIFNRASALVGARSRCNSQTGGGLLPIAVRRYVYEEDTSQQLDLVANKNADPRKDPCPTCYYPATSGTEFLPGRYTGGEPTFPFHPLLSQYEPITGSLTYTMTGNIDCAPPNYKGDLQYVGTCVLGELTYPNTKPQSYGGFVSFDIRNIAGSGPIEYYNGAGGQDATNKALALLEGWFCERGWSGGPIPRLGDQLAYLPGTPTNFAVKTMLGCDPPFIEEEQFVAVVYSGYIWQIPQLEMTVQPDDRHLCADFPCPVTDTVSYDVTFTKPDASPPWGVPAVVYLDSLMDKSGAAYSVITPTVTFSENPVTLEPDQYSALVTMTVSATETITTSYLSALTVHADETNLGLDRWASTNFVYGDVPWDFTLYAKELEVSIARGDVGRVSLITRGFGGLPLDKKAVVTVELLGADWASVFTSRQTGTMWVENGVDNTLDLALKVKRDAIFPQPPGPYRVKLTVDPKDAAPRSVEVAVHIYEPTGGVPDKFVLVEGFAPFEISYIGSDDLNEPNTIAAFAIGPIVPDLSDIEWGMNPSLLPW